MSTIKIGIIGIGRMGEIHLENLCAKIKDVEVIAAVNPSERGQDFARKYGVSNTSDDVDLVFKNPKIDAVVICSPNNSHADYISRAAEVGKAVFCEKPIDMSLDKVKDTLNKVEKYKVPMMIAFNQRFDKDFAKVQAAVKKEEIGKPYNLHIISRDPAPPPIDYIKNSGGLFKDMTIHDFDMARFIIGSEVTEVYAKGSNLIDSDIGKAGDIDTGIVILSFKNGATATIENSRKAVYGYDQRLEIFGSKGMMKVENPLKTNVRLLNETGTVLDRHLNFFMDRYETTYLSEMKAFIDALKNKKEMPVTGEDGLRAMIIAEAANISLRENRPIKIKDI